MKNFIKPFIPGLFALAILCISEVHEVKKSNADVATVKGLLIFTDSSPNAPHEKIGYIKYSKSWATINSYSHMKNRFIDKCKEQYPNADGLILSLDENVNYTAEVIKFKD